MKLHGHLLGSLLAASLVAALGGVSAQAAEPSPALKAMITAAQSEGKLDLQWGSDILGGGEGMKEIAAGMNAMYGTKIDVRFTPGPNLNDILNTVIV